MERVEGKLREKTGFEEGAKLSGQNALILLGLLTGVAILLLVLLAFLFDFGFGRAVTTTLLVSGAFATGYLTNMFLGDRIIKMLKKTQSAPSPGPEWKEE